MRNKLFSVSFVFLTAFYIGQTDACTSLIVTKGASATGSVIVTYNCDGEFHPGFEYKPAADYKPGDSLTISSWGGKVFKIPQVRHTYAVMKLINEYQVSIGETTFGGREELVNPDGKLRYWTLMQLALQRARTAREAIGVITSLTEQFGYASSGETFSIGDKNEAWIMEIIGAGPGGKGAIWVARRIPEGYISAHANKSRIGEFPLDDPHNCLYSDNVIDFAVEKGYYNPESGEPFRFNEAYCPATPTNQRYADGRVWSIFRRAAPSLNLSSDYFRGKEGAKPYPLWIKPDKKLSIGDVFSLMRDHYEGTEFDMTKGIDAGPFGSPNRWRPISWKVDDKIYAWERPISTQQTGFSMVTQSRDWLPDAIGGVIWYGLDDTYLSCYMPIYCGNNQVEKSLRTGRLDKFSWDSAWWVFNFVANFANLKYSYMSKDILTVRRAIESNLLAIQPAVEKTALELYLEKPESAVKYLTDYSISHVRLIVDRYRDLGEYLIAKYNDGYVQEKPGRPAEKGYPTEWLRRVLKEKPEQYFIPVKKEKKPESKLID